jgi:hypothetical protein
MKKLFFAALLCAMMMYGSFAEGAKAVKKDFELKASAGKVVIGSLKAVLPSDLSRPETGLIVSDENGRDISFTVKPLAVIYSAVDGTLMSIRDIPSGGRVQVSYLPAPQGKLRATAIKVLGNAAEAGMKPARQEEEAIK